jgi:hypothetical protein
MEGWVFRVFVNEWITRFIGDACEDDFRPLTAVGLLELGLWEFEGAAKIILPHTRLIGVVHVTCSIMNCTDTGNLRFLLHRRKRG